MRRRGVRCGVGPGIFKVVRGTGGWPKMAILRTFGLMLHVFLRCLPVCYAGRVIHIHLANIYDFFCTLFEGLTMEPGRLSCRFESLKFQI